MIIIYLIIFIISIDGIIPTKNSSINRFILISSCQGNNHGLESIQRKSNHQYYFHLSIQLSSTYFLSLLPLSYCEHQQTTYYSSSGFSILRSSPRFLFTDIDNLQQTSSFHHHHNASLSIVDQSLSTTIVTLMSSNENNLFVDSDYNNTITKSTTTTINSLLSTTVSNVSLFQTSLSTIPQRANRTFNISLIIGCISASLIFIIIIIYAFIKYRNRDEGSYKIDESKNFVTNSPLENQDNNSRGGKIILSTHHRQKLLAANEQNGVDSREWYV